MPLSMMGVVAVEDRPFPARAEACQRVVGPQLAIDGGGTRCVHTVGVAPLNIDQEFAGAALKEIAGERCGQHRALAARRQRPRVRQSVAGAEIDEGTGIEQTALHVGERVGAVAKIDTASHHAEIAHRLVAGVTENCSAADPVQILDRAIVRQRIGRALGNLHAGSPAGGSGALSYGDVDRTAVKVPRIDASIAGACGVAIGGDGERPGAVGAGSNAIARAGDRAIHPDGHGEIGTAPVGAGPSGGLARHSRKAGNPIPLRRAIEGLGCRIVCQPKRRNP